MENHPSRIPLKCIKGASLSGHRVGGSGYLIGPSSDGEANPCRHVLNLRGNEPFSFLFAFTGLGHHCRLDIRPADSVIALYQIRDGIPLYLHHFSTVLRPDESISIVIFHCQIRIGIGSHQVMHAMVESEIDARIGFAPLHPSGYNLPDYHRAALTMPMPAWLCLGDGFSNSRWRNRSFLSWPELVFGHRDDWFNGCVAAGNSRRVLQTAKELAPLCNRATTLIAVGSDDLIEGDPYEEFAQRLQSTVSLLRKTGCGPIHIATLPPRASAVDATRDWSGRLREFAADHELGVLDFHSWLEPRMDLMVRGEYPGRDAQVLLAERVLETLSLPEPPPPPASLMAAPSNGFSRRIIQRIKRHADRSLDDFPGVLY